MSCRVIVILVLLQFALPPLAAWSQERIYFRVNFTDVNARNYDGSGHVGVRTDVAGPDVMFDPDNEYLYWGTTSGGTRMFFRGNSDGSGTATLVAAHATTSLNAMAFDPVTDQILWIDAQNGKIFRSNVVTATTNTVLSTTGTLRYGIDIDHSQGHLYFVSNSTLKRIDLDGSNLTSIRSMDVSTILGGLAVDEVNEVVYLAGYSGSPNTAWIKKVPFDGSSETNIIEGSNAYGANDLEIDGELGLLFWSGNSSSGTKYIRRCSTDGSGITNIITSSSNFYYGLALDRRRDCNNNSIPDNIDIANATSLDCNGDGVPDECEIAADPSLDCDLDGNLDTCEILADPSQDCDSDGILDNCEIAADPTLDCSGNGVLDACDAASLTLPNDLSAFATVIGNGSHNFSTVGATSDGLIHATCPAEIVNDIWYRYQASCTGILTVSMCSSTNFDNQMAIYSDAGCPSDATLLACDDNSAGCGTGSRLNVPVVLGEWYLIRVGGNAAGVSSGVGFLDVGCGITPACPPVGGTPYTTNTYQISGTPTNTPWSWRIAAVGGDFLDIEDQNVPGVPDPCIANPGCNAWDGALDVANAWAQSINAQAQAFGCDNVPGDGMVSLHATAQYILGSVILSIQTGQSPLLLFVGSAGSQATCQVTNGLPPCSLNPMILEQPALEMEELLVEQIPLPGLDCNANGYDDFIDIQSGESVDGNLNGIPDECEATSGIGDDPRRIGLIGSYPNPFPSHGTTTVVYSLDSPTDVTLRVFDVAGREVRALIENLRVSRGTHQVLWDGRDNQGVLVPPGLYFYRLLAENLIQSRKLLVIR